MDKKGPSVRIQNFRSCYVVPSPSFVLSGEGRETEGFVGGGSGGEEDERVGGKGTGGGSGGDRE